MFQKLCVKELSLDISDGILFMSYRVDTIHGYSHDLIMKRIYRRLLEEVQIILPALNSNKVLLTRKE